MYKKILVPLDGSPAAECVFDHVKAIATGCSVPEVILLLVLEPVDSMLHTFYVPADWPEQLKEAEKKAKTEAEEYLSKVKERMERDGISAKTAFVMSSEVAEEILKFAADNQVDLIIMSTHGRSGATRWAFGSIADRVIRHSTVPVLIVLPKGCRVS